MALWRYLWYRSCREGSGNGVHPYISQRHWQEVRNAQVFHWAPDRAAHRSTGEDKLLELPQLQSRDFLTCLVCRLHVFTNCCDQMLHSKAFCYLLLLICLFNFVATEIPNRVFWRKDYRQGEFSHQTEAAFLTSKVYFLTEVSSPVHNTALQLLQAPLEWLEEACKSWGDTRRHRPDWSAHQPGGVFLRLPERGGFCGGLWLPGRLLHLIRGFQQTGELP